MNKLWDNINHGVRPAPPNSAPSLDKWTSANNFQRQWKDIRSKYLEGGDEDDE